MHDQHIPLNGEQIYLYFLYHFVDRGYALISLNNVVMSVYQNISHHIVCGITQHAAVLGVSWKPLI